MKKSKSSFEYNDSYPTCQRTYVTLLIYLPDTQSPDTVTARLGLKPSRTQVKGEMHGGRKKLWPNGWFLTSEGKVQSRDVRRHIDWLLEQLDHKMDNIQELMHTGAEICISCFWTSAKGHGGPMLDPRILKRLAETGLGLGFDIYFEGDEDVPEGLRPLNPE